MVEGQEYPVELTIKEAGLEKIQTFYNFKEHWSRSVSDRVTRRIGDSQYA